MKIKSDVINKSTHTPALTKYPSGSLRELWAISFPLMLSLMSGSLMLFSDRLFLARFSMEALTASATSSLIVSGIQFGFISTAAIAEVFVGRHNGAGRLHRVGQPVWQMIWFSLLTIAFFWPVGIFTAPYIFDGSPYAELEIIYFSWLMGFGPIFCLVGTLSAFYIGRGCVKFVTLSVIGANILNILFDIILIFGYEPFQIPSFGIAGAAISTGLSQSIQCIILFLAFLARRNRKLFGTMNYAFHRRAFMQCLRVGIPNSLTHTLEIFAWAALFRMMVMVGTEHVIVLSICQSIFFLFTFITDGISKGATAIASNLIGAGKWDLVRKLLFSGIKFYFVMFLLLGFFFVLDPDPLIRWFIPDEPTIGSVSIYTIIASACLWIWIFFLFDGINWLIVGLLTAAGDVKFILKVGGATPWLFAILPTYILVVQFGKEADAAWQMSALYSVLTCAIYLWRFQSGKWKEASNLSLKLLKLSDKSSNQNQ